ncbi:DUF1854 domain-containing protein [Paenibacillus gansuensis]|uniref:DUF1854 domain-containing protein n=1 Tax=Paenibacillus gansuensis TaxID=306542 RepID=A0ABW5PBC1_9BACL
MGDPYDIHMLDPERVSFTRGAGGVLQGILEGTYYNELVVYRTFPFQYTKQFISIRNPKGEEIGIVQNVDYLEETSRKEVEQELQFRYLLPRVTRVNSVKQKNDLWQWDLQTHIGPTRITMRNLHEFMQYPGDRRIILTDLNGKRCEIQDWQTLDSHSRNQLRDVL